jgi:HEAT repeat protein
MIKAWRVACNLPHLPKTENVVSIQLTEKASGRVLGTASEQDLAILVGYMEEESSKDQDYYVEATAIDALEGLGASREFVALLRAAVGTAEGVDIVWSRA